MKISVSSILVISLENIFKETRYAKSFGSIFLEYHILLFCCCESRYGSRSGERIIVIRATLYWVLTKYQALGQIFNMCYLI